MDENLITRLESAVTRLEAMSAGGFLQVDHVADAAGDASAMDPSIVAFGDLISQFVNRVVSAAENIGGHVLDISKIIDKAFHVQKELLVKIKQTQKISGYGRGRISGFKPDMAGLVEFLKPLNEVTAEASALTEGRRSDSFHHLKTGADSLSALAWIAYTGKNCGLSMPTAHVEESWHTAEFYSNKILMEFKNKDANHVEWVTALKELYIPGLRDYVKSHYPLGPVWSATGRKIAPAPTKAPTPPSAPPSLLSSGTASSSRPKEGMAAVFQEINSGKPVTSGLRKVTADMKTKNRADRTSVVSLSEKESHASSPRVSKTGPPKMELEMGRKVNNITVDKCTKMGVVFKLVRLSIVIPWRCNARQYSRLQLYLSKDSLEASITTAKSSEVNVLIPASDSPGDWGEHCLPQQYAHVYKDGQFVTTPVSHSGG
ncbi:UNVERIFIED_CONTAM: Cyclase-associated protein 1 [Sesamum radiatum]|uniref:Adenylyl cyclase-associated protein n=1 Tax=Sesamum radiatum TaxID=300843 RepID=A0AAW2S3M0_SESRA